MTDSLSRDTGGEQAKNGKTDVYPGTGTDPGTAGEAGVGLAADALTIRGRVRDSLGVALPRALVTLTGPGGGRRLAKTRSAADGAFSLTAPRHGDYLLAAFSPQLGSQSVTVSLTGRPVEVEFHIAVPGSASP